MPLPGLFIYFQCEGAETLALSPKQYETHVGSKFGAALASIDVTGDGFDELFVGAPLYTDAFPEEGRVYVYTFVDNVNLSF